jgi:hypothetical protein
VTDVMQYFPLLSMLVSLLTGPIVLGAVSAIHERKTNQLLREAIREAQAEASKTYATKLELFELRAEIRSALAKIDGVAVSVDRVHEALIRFEGRIDSAMARE